MLRRIFSYMKQYKGYAVIALVCVGVECVFELVIPLIMADMVDVGVATGDRAYIFEKGMLMIGCALCALVLVSARCAVRGWGRICGKRNTESFRRFLFPISTISGSRPL